METSLRARIRAGDPDAFGRLFDEHSRGVYNHAFRLIGDWSTAEDVMSLTFLEAWRLRAQVEPDGGSLRPWLLGITTNVARNTARAARRHREALRRLPPAEVAADFAGEVAGRLDDARRLAAVHRALGRLHRAEREVFALCVWAGLDYAAAAEALRVPVGTVRSRLARARARLRKLTASELEPGHRDREPRGGAGQVEDRRVTAPRSTRRSAHEPR